MSSSEYPTVSFLTEYKEKKNDFKIDFQLKSFSWVEEIGCENFKSIGAAFRE